MSEDYKKVLESQLWNIANTLRGKMNADEFRDYILGFIFYKYLSEKMNIFADEILEQNEILPERTKYMLQFMIKENWLMHYATTEGLNKILTAMSRRAKFENNMHQATAYLESHYDDFKNEFKDFFDVLRIEVGKR